MTAPANYKPRQWSPKLDVGPFGVFTDISLSTRPVRSRRWYLLVLGVRIWRLKVMLDFQWWPEPYKKGKS